MIPSNDLILLEELKIETQPSLNHRMMIERNIINGKVDRHDAMIQVIYKILNTERYVYGIYSWNYGVELVDLFGKSVNFVCAELPQRITDALMMDDRVTGVDSFEFDTTTKGNVLCTFLVHTIFGDYNIEKVVEI